MRSVGVVNRRARVPSSSSCRMDIIAYAPGKKGEEDQLSGHHQPHHTFERNRLLVAGETDDRAASSRRMEKGALKVGIPGSNTFQQRGDIRRVEVHPVGLLAGVDHLEGDPASQPRHPAAKSAYLSRRWDDGQGGILDQLDRGIGLDRARIFSLKTGWDDDGCADLLVFHGGRAAASSG